MRIFVAVIVAVAISVAVTEYRRWSVNKSNADLCNTIVHHHVMSTPPSPTKPLWVLDICWSMQGKVPPEETNNPLFNRWK